MSTLGRRAGIVFVVLLVFAVSTGGQDREESSLPEVFSEPMPLLSKALGEFTRPISPEDEAKKTAPILLEAQDMLLKWEAGDTETVALWKMMNQWVYKGFDTTYKNLGVDFDNLYYESQTYLLGKEFVAEGLKRGVFFKKDDGSVWCDLTEDGLD